VKIWFRAYFFAAGVFLNSLSSQAGAIFPIWRGSDFSEFSEESWIARSKEGRLVQLDLEVAGVNPPVATDECGAAFVFLHEGV
jgi:hypothetical protein